MDSSQVDEAEVSALAAFALAQVSFWALFHSGLLSKPEAEKMLGEAIAANKQGGPANILAAAKLEPVLKLISAAERTTRQ